MSINILKKANKVIFFSIKCIALIFVQEAIHQAGGATQAAEIIEQAVQTVEPVLAESSR